MLRGLKRAKKACLEQGRRVFVAMSGGVDSSMTAALLKERGYDVSGVFLNLGQVGFKPAFEAVKKVAKKIGIPLKIVDARKEFKKEVISYFLKTYASGNTPNPCVVCNQKIKFGLLFKLTEKLKFDCLATGHYVRLRNRRLFAARDKNKDQSYFLYNLTQKHLAKLIFPLGDYTKDQIRKMADKRHLPHLKKESQDICFLACEHNEFLRKNLKLKKGKILTIGGKVIGEHEGLPLYTIGQRRGFSIGGGTPYYVVAKGIKRNLLIVSDYLKEEKFYKKEADIKNVNWISGKPPAKNKIYKARLRYRQPLESCRIENLKLKIKNSKNYRVIFIHPQRAITPGQSLVLYRGSELLGGGVII